MIKDQKLGKEASILQAATCFPFIVTLHQNKKLQVFNTITDSVQITDVTKLTKFIWQQISQNKLHSFKKTSPGKRYRDH